MNDTGDLGPTSTPGIGKMGRVELREVSRHEAPEFRVVGRTTLTCSVTVSVERLACLPPGAHPVGSDWQQNVMPLLLAAADIEQEIAPVPASPRTP